MNTAFFFVWCIDIVRWLLTVLVVLLMTGWCCQDVDHFRYEVTEEAKVYLKDGSPEAQLYNAIPSEGIAMAQLKVAVVFSIR